MASSSPAREADLTAGKSKVTESPLISDVWHELDELRRRVAALEASQVHDACPARDDAALCSALAATFGASVFSVADIRTAASRELQALMVGMRPRAVGRWLKKLSREAPAPYAVQRIGRDAAGVVWAVSMRGLHAHP